MENIGITKENANRLVDEFLEIGLVSVQGISDELGL